MDQVTISSGPVVAAIVGAWFWDLVMNVPETVRIYSHRSFRLPDVVYILSRVTSGGLFLTAFIYLVAPTEDCQRLVFIGCWFAAFALPLNCMLFLFRIWGVFLHSRFIPHLFSVLWLCTCTSFIAPFTFKAAHVDKTTECFIQWVSVSSLAAFVSITVYDTLVFIAISCQLLTFIYAQGWRARIRLFFCGGKMGNISKALLQSGQCYYLISICINLLVVLFFTMKGISPSLKVVFAILNIALQNSMACRVFRYLRSDSLSSSLNPIVVSSSFSSPRFNSMNHETIVEMLPYGNPAIHSEGSLEPPPPSAHKLSATSTGAQFSENSP